MTTFWKASVSDPIQLFSPKRIQIRIRTQGVKSMWIHTYQESDPGHILPSQKVRF
jgi:hypothetical protein